jgi:hypothetical protein
MNLYKSIFYLAFIILISSCQKEDGFWNLKRANDLDPYSKNFPNNAFMIENATITNPRREKTPDGWQSDCGSVELNLKINKINDGLVWYVGICWDTIINPSLKYGTENNATVFKVDRTNYLSDVSGTMNKIGNEITYTINGKYYGLGLNAYLTETGLWDDGSGRFYLSINKVYHFRYFIYIKSYSEYYTSGFGKQIRDVINNVKYSSDFKIIIP